MTIDTSREAAEQLIARLRNPLMLRKGDYDRAADMLADTLAERDAVLAEVARLSTAPDDAEARMWVEALTETAKSHDDAYDDSGHLMDKALAEEARGASAFITRLSRAHEAEEIKREAMEHALHALAEACEGEPSEVFEGEIGGVLTHAHATLAAHAARRKE